MRCQSPLQLNELVHVVAATNLPGANEAHRKTNNDTDYTEEPSVQRPTSRTRSAIGTPSLRGCTYTMKTHACNTRNQNTRAPHTCLAKHGELGGYGHQRSGRAFVRPAVCDGEQEVRDGPPRATTLTHGNSSTHTHAHTRACTHRQPSKPDGTDREQRSVKGTVSQHCSRHQQEISKRKRHQSERSGC